MPSIALQINGLSYSVEAEAQMPLLWVLRDLLNLTGTKFGCGAGLRGSCTVLVDNEPVYSCITYAIASDGEPTGIGEMGVPPIAPAVANAVFAATGKQVRRTPIQLEDLKA